MDLLLILVSTILLIPTSNAQEEIYQNSTNICQRCKCIQGPQFVLDCQKQGFHHMLANWPEHNISLIAAFSYNNFSNLELLPDSDLVTQVILSHCGIKSLDNGVFKAVKNIKYLDLSYNLLTTEEIAPEKFKGPYNDTVYEPLLIEHLDLSYNQIHSLPKNIFEHLTSLQDLNLEGNKLRVLDPPTQMALNGLKNLQVLNLGNNQLTEIVGDAIKNMKSLRTLSLAMNKLDFVPGTLSLLGDSLEEVYLDDNLIFELTDESFLGVKGIKILSLTNLSRLQYITANAFAPLQNLRILFLSDNPTLKTIDPEAFGVNPRVNQTLEELYLHNNSLQDLHYNLTKWSSLQVLSLHDNDLICDCDLYKISQELNKEIKRDEDGPYCVNPVTDSSDMIYNLTEDACSHEWDRPRVAHVIDHHFRVVGLITVTLSSVFTLFTVVVLLLVFFKYRRNRMNRNYPFTTQVMYNPLRGPPTN